MSARFITAALLFLPATFVGAQSVSRLEIARQDSSLSISFIGVLQSSDSLDADWHDVPGASSPYTPSSQTVSRFYRARHPESLFATNSIASLSFSGPFQQYFEMAFAGMPDGIFPPIRPKPYFEGFVSINGRSIPVDLRVRGNSSLQECPFPKLKFKVSTQDRFWTPFADAREVKIGTHCADDGEPGSIGRLRDQIATYREALVYDLMRALDFTTPRTRRAQVHYSDTTPPNGMSEVGWQRSRNALLLEDIEVVAQRLGGRALDDEEIAKLANASFDPQLITELRLFHILLGNWDYALSVGGRGLWNTEVIEFPGPSYLPVAGDFDLAAFVTGVVLSNAPHYYRPETPPVEREAYFLVEQLHSEVEPASFAAARTRFLDRRAVLESIISAAQVDEPGRANAVRHLNAFFAALAELKDR